MLTLKNFEAELPVDILDKGMYYCNANRVQKLTITGPGKWTAVISGKTKYNVSITLSGEKIKSWKCSCPDNRGDVCEHVVAVLYQLYNYLDIEDVNSDFTEEEVKSIQKKLKKANTSKSIK